MSNTNLTINLKRASKIYHEGVSVALKMKHNLMDYPLCKSNK